MSKFSFIIEITWAFFIIVSIIHDTFMGISNHDVYYLVWVILELIMLHFSVKNIKDYIDKTDNV